MDNLAGQQIKGYELKERVAAGGFGAVYRAQQSTVGREVAVKVILPGLANKPDFIRRFEAEAQLIARLEHHFIVPLYDYWRDPDGAYLVMRYLRGGSLHDRIRKLGALSIEEAFNLFSQIAQGLHVAHRNQVIHRDIKPGNVLLDEDGTGFLADFGIAKDHTTSQSITEPDSFIGSPEYLAPEQARSEPVTPQTDIYSLGVVLYEMLMGEHPFPGLEKIAYIFKHLNEPLPDITILDDRICDDVNDVIQKATAKDPKQRFADVIEMMKALRKAAQLDATPTPTSLVELLTPREQEVMQLIIDGNTNREIADMLVLAEGTVKQYINNIYRKLNVRSRVQAIARARDLNFVISKPDAAISVSTQHLPEPDNPYKGLQAFHAADAQHFFGREKLTQKLLNRLQENSEHQRFLSVVGPSGSGKSSVVKAGLIPALWRGDLPGSENWYIVDMLPGNRSLDELEVALFQIATDKSMNLREQLQRDAAGLLRVADMILPDDDSELLIVIDQFEEVFTLLEDEAQRKHFLNLIREAVTDKRSRVRVVATLRADYYDRPLQYPEFGELMRERVETVLPLSAEELERAINEPAQQVGVRFEDGLVSRIVSDVHYQPGALPLLQYALTELFERREDRRLTLEAYNDIGGTGGALAKRADEIYLEGNNEGQELVRQLFLRLVTLGEGAEDTRRRVERAELLSIVQPPPVLPHRNGGGGAIASEGVRELMDEIIDLYAASRLLSLDNDPSTRRPTVEVAHEAILREWDRLRQWLNESRDDIRQERLIAQAAEAWKINNQDKSYLLTGTRLENAENWRDVTELALTPLESEFIQASIQEARVQELREAERLAREEAQERRSRTLLRALVAVFAVAAVIAGGLALFALNARDAEAEARLAAETAEQEALRQASIGLAALAREEMDSGSQDRAVLLALEALEHYPHTVQAESALASGVESYLPSETFMPSGQLVSDFIVAAWSSDGGRVAALGQDGLVLIWDQSGNLIESWDVYQIPCFIAPDLVWSPDSRKMALTAHFRFGASKECPIPMPTVIDTVTGEKVLVLSGHDGEVKTIDWSRDGARILTGGNDSTIRLWDAETGNEVAILEGHDGTINSAEWSPDGRLIASVSTDETVRIWDTVGGNELFRLEGHIGEVADVSWSPDGKQLVTGGEDQLLRVWDSVTGELINILIGPTIRIRSVDWSPDGSRIAAKTQDNNMWIWDATTGAIFREFRDNSYGSFLWSPDSTEVTIPTTSESGNPGVLLVDIRLRTPILQGHEDWALGAYWFPDGRTLMTTSFDTTSRLWDFATGAEIARFKHPARVMYGGISPDGSRIGTAGGDDFFRIWDTDSGEMLFEIPSPMGFTPITMEWSHDGTRIVGNTFDSDLNDEFDAIPALIWDAETGEQLHELTYGRNCQLYKPSWSPDGDRLVTACMSLGEPGRNTPALIWDTDTGELVMELEGEDGWTGGATWSPDGTLIATGHETGIIWVRQVSTGEELVSFAGHSTAAFALSWSPDGTRIASGDDSGNVKIWNVNTGEELFSFVAPDIVFTVEWSPDGSFVSAAGGFPEPIIKRIWQSTEELIDYAYDCCVFRELTTEERQQFGLPER